MSKEKAAPGSGGRTDYGRGREMNDFRPLLRRAFQMQGAAMHLHEFSGIVKAKAETADLPGMGWIDLIEFFKNLGHFLPRNPRSGIAYLQMHRVAVDAPFDVNFTAGEG